MIPFQNDDDYAFGHNYSISTVKISLALLIKSLCSFRGTAKSLEIFSSCSLIECASYSAISQWAYRIGLYAIKHNEFEKREDRIIIIDHLIQTGATKCLLILTTTLDKVVDSDFSLKHDDIEVVDIKIMAKSDGIAIEEILNETKEKVGPIMQLVTDKGPDINKGCSLFVEKNPMTVYTYDVTHAMAAIVKREFKNDKNFYAFLEKCAETGKKLRQTDLCFLLPPPQRTKSLYLNVNKFFDWANTMLEYKQKEDFSSIEVKDKNALAQLEKFNEQKNKDLPADKIVLITEMKNKMRNNFAKERFEENLGWLEEYSKDLKPMMK